MILTNPPCVVVRNRRAHYALRKGFPAERSEAGEGFPGCGSGQTVPLFKGTDETLNADEKAQPMRAILPMGVGVTAKVQPFVYETNG